MLAYALTGSNLVSFDLAAPNTALTTVSIVGLTAGETLVGIDFRPANGLLYGLGVNAGADTGTLYVISTRTGVAGAVGSFAGVGDLPPGNFGFDFNPSVDRIRVTTDTGLNFRLNPNSGAVAGVDTSIPAHDISGVAYTNNNRPDNGNITTLYTLDALSDFLNIQNPPNGGVQLPVGALGVDFSNANGFDIPSGVDAPANNAVTSGTGYALLTAGGSVRLYGVDLLGGAATLVGTFLDGVTPTGGLAIQNTFAGIPVVALSADGTTLVRFDSAAPATLAGGAISGIAAGETLVAIDYRPLTGELYGLAVDAAADTGTLYLLQVQGGGATAIGAPAGIAFVSGGGAVDLPAGGYGMDFDPTVDRIRITTESGLNFRIEPILGAPVDGDAIAAGTNPDVAINGGATGASATAYTNSFGQLPGGPTTQYTLDAASDTLFIQNSSLGTLSTPHAVTLNGSPLDFTSVNGFDIPGGVKVTSSGSPAIGFGYAGLTVGGVTSLYRIDLATGAATNLGAIGAGTTQIAGLALGDAPAVPVITSDGGGATANVSIVENTLPVTTVVAIDSIGPVSDYSIVGGADAGKFAINSTTGALAFIAAPDFEAPGDADHNNSYIVQVRAADGGLSDDQTITVTVTNTTNEAAPTITSNGGGDNATVSVPENTTAVTTVIATDADAGTTLAYSIAGGADAGKFAINSSTGALAFIAAPNFEAPGDADHNNSYIVQVRASDGSLFDEQAVTVNVTDVANEAPPHWLASVGLPAHPPGWSLSAIGDLTGDGTSDMVWYNATTGNVDLWKITNAQWAGSNNLGSHPLGWQPAGIGDFNGDGTNDLLWHNPTTGNVDLWKLVNGQWAGSVDVGTHALGSQVAGIGDFTGDGTSDVLWYNPTNGATEIWKIVNGQRSAALDLGSHPLGWTPAGVGDFNHDGTSDIAWYNATTGNLEIWQIVNGQWNASSNIGSHPLGWTPAGIGEFNGDGSSDIVWYNSATGNVDLWQIVNAQWAGSINLGSHPPGSVPSGIGDFNHDATSDIVWRETTTGLIDQWLISNV